MDKVRFSSQELIRKQPENNQKRTRSQTRAQQQPPKNQPVNNNTPSRKQSETLETSTGSLAGPGAPTGISEASHGQYIHFRRLPIEKLCKSRHEHLLLNHSACFFVFIAWTHMSNLDHDCTSLANNRQNKFRGSIQPGLTIWMSSL